MAAVNVLDDFVSENGSQEHADVLARWEVAGSDRHPWPSDVRDTVREDLADAVRTLRVEQHRLIAELTDTLIKWTIGTGIVVAGLVIAALKWL
jgi:hypothetical protein